MNKLIISDKATNTDITCTLKEVEYDRAKSIGIDIAINSPSFRKTYYNVWLEAHVLYQLRDWIKVFRTNSNSVFNYENSFSMRLESVEDGESDNKFHLQLDIQTQHLELHITEHSIQSFNKHIDNMPLNLLLE